MKLDFYYWGYQCPLNKRVIDILIKYKNKIDIKYYDISNDFELTKEMKMYYPTLIVVNNVDRYYSPIINESFLDDLVLGRIQKEKPYRPKQGTIQKNGNIIPLTKDKILVACLCTGQNNNEFCSKKKSFLSRFPSSIYGYLNVDDANNLLGGVEFLPSLLVPYGIPRKEDIAFITCVYSTHSYFDYKSGPLEKLESYLKEKYKKVIVISDEEGTFPNGDLNFFLRNGYQDSGIIYEDKNYCTLHLLEKLLK